MKRVLSTPKAFEIAVLLFILSSCSYQLFFPPLLGMADNGDFGRLFYPAGLKQVSAQYSDNYFNYFNSKYLVAPPLAVDDLPSSSSLFIHAARWLNINFISEEVFDIRVLAAIYLAVFLFGVGLIIVSSRILEMKWRILLGALLAFMLTDPAYVAYFNSFYSEATAFVCIIMVVGCSLVLITGRSTGWAALAGYFAAAAILVTAKPMYVPAALLIAPYGIYLSGAVSFKHRYWVGATAACAILVLAAWYQQQTPAWLRLNSGYVGVFTTILKSSPTPEQDIADLGLNPQWAQYAGTSPFDEGSPAKTDAAFRAEFAERVGTFTVPRFFLTHPDRFYTIASRTAETVLITRPHYAGYYEKESGNPPLAKPLAPWSDARAWLFPVSLWFMIVYSLSGLVAIGLSFRRRLTSLQRGLLLLYALLVLFGATVFLVPVLTLGAFDTRFSMPFASALDLALLITLGALMQWAGGAWKKRRAVTAAAAQPQADSKIGYSSS